MRSPLPILIILVPLILLGVIFYVSTRETHIPKEEQEMSHLLPEGSLNEKGETIEGVDNHETAQASIGARTDAIDYIVSNISRLSPKEPVLGGSWHVTRFWFVDDENFYVEYEDGHIMGKILVSEVDESYTIIGYFEPGENDWNLVEGSDHYFGEPLDLYEYSEKTGKWIKKN